MLSRVGHQIRYAIVFLFSPIVILVGCDNERPATAQSRRVDNQLIDSVAKKKLPRTVAKPRIRERSVSKRITDSRVTRKKRTADEEPSSDPQTGGSEQLENSTKKERNLEIELQSLVGNPIGCLSPQSGAQAADKINLALEAYVTANGIVSRSSVKSSHLSNIELACIKKRIDSARFRAPIVDAPRAIRTTATLKRAIPPHPPSR